MIRTRDVSSASFPKKPPMLPRCIGSWLNHGERVSARARCIAKFAACKIKRIARAGCRPVV